MTERFDAAVIGAGPAGMAAATSLAEQGARVLVLDEADRTAITDRLVRQVRQAWPLAVDPIQEVLV